MGDLKGSSEYPLKRIWIFKGLSVRPSIGYPMIQGHCPIFSFALPEENRLL